MDKSWMDPTLGRCSRKYILGCEKFIEFAWNNRIKELGGEIYCPCVGCLNLMLLPKHIVEHHIKNHGILRSYVRWTKHGESVEVNTESNRGDDMHTMLQDALGFQNMGEIDGVEVVADTIDEDIIDDVECDEDFINDSDCDEDIDSDCDEDNDDSAMVKRFREDPNGDEWGTSTLPKVFDQPNGSKLELDKWELDETGRSPLWLDFGDEFRNKKSKWKRNFYTRYATYEERISHRPEQLSQQEWVQLMEFWDMILWSIK
ncbi:hypothetical protein IFM89_020689 [Coptis chinensis]|uniref:Transposase-associated domain-containing protein n=1 Tax=Coptis chinensis TaxID=261450 RepID=A0A835LWJ2_9MAGN|nr:hypothetical protein IFM89_020689 [Coptis chinensis]